MSKNIGIQDDTYERLDNQKSPGQSFDGVIREILDHFEMWKANKKNGDPHG